MAFHQIGDKVIGPFVSRDLNICEVVARYIGTGVRGEHGGYVYKIRHCARGETYTLESEENLQEIKGRYIATAAEIWDTEHPVFAILVSNSRARDDSKLVERIADLLNTYGGPIEAAPPPPHEEYDPPPEDDPRLPEKEETIYPAI